VSLRSCRCNIDTGDSGVDPLLAPIEIVEIAHLGPTAPLVPDSETAEVNEQIVHDCVAPGGRRRVGNDMYRVDA
jgi:hypothetical protein